MFELIDLFRRRENFFFENQVPENEELLYVIGDYKWRNGFICINCGCEKTIKPKNPTSKRCAYCKQEESATAHTVFHRMKIPVKDAVQILCDIMFDVKRHFIIWSKEIEMNQRNVIDKFEKNVLYKQRIILRQTTTELAERRGHQQKTIWKLLDRIMKAADEKDVKPRFVKTPSYYTALETDSLEELYSHHELSDFMESALLFEEKYARHPEQVEPWNDSDNLPDPVYQNQLYLNYRSWFKGIDPKNTARYMRLLSIFISSKLSDEMEVTEKERLLLLENILKLQWDFES